MFVPHAWIGKSYILFIPKSSRSFLDSIYLWPAEMRTGCIFYQESRSGTWFPAKYAHNDINSSSHPLGKIVRALDALQKILARA